MDPELEPPLVHFAATDHDSVDTAVSTNPGGGGKLQRCEEKALMISVSSLHSTSNLQDPDFSSDDPGSSLCSGRTVKCGADAAHGGRLLSLIGKKLYLHVVGVEPSERSTISVDSTEVCDTRESDGIASSDELKQRGFDILMLSELMELEAMKSSSQLNHMVLPRFLN
ncbi:hypothetical protein HID58_006395 [Brassica napus]|uniref:Uncharacterized protein n=2 Tax=Brassica TaxID=3705 RepID=M4DPP8_BRACM|nr:hypothetical protein HID58_006395 [Brassica napus]CAF2141464.1 unnamed protein product [Brassica napus]